MTDPLRITYKKVGDFEIPTNVFLPSPSSVRRDLAPVLLNIHGGAFIVGHAGMVSKLQIEDCLERGWIVLALEHRLCPGVTLLDGPMSDVRDALKWVQDGSFGEALKRTDAKVKPDKDRVLAMGTSSGGHLALILAYDVPKPPIAILDFYGTKHFQDSFWSKHPPREPAPVFAPLYDEKCTIIGGLSLEGQAKPGGNPEPPGLRQKFIQQTIRDRNVLQVVVPDGNEGPPDPYANVHASWPPTCVVHGDADSMFPIDLSRKFVAKLKDYGVDVKFIEVEDEPHTFVARMEKGSKTWNMQRKGFDFLEEKLEGKFYARNDNEYEQIIEEKL